LIIVAFLIMMSLLARTANRVVQVAGQRERIAVEGPSSESVDRARAKLEHMFTREPLPNDPSEQSFEDFLGNRRRDPVSGRITARLAVDIYTLPDEVRCQAQDGNCLGGGGAFTPDGIAPTWAYRVDLNGNGSVNDPQDGVAVYSIIGRVVRDGKSAVPLFNPDGSLRTDVDYLKERQRRAAHFLVNNAPARAQSADSFCAGATTGGAVNEKGRFSTGSSAEEVKNFQIYAVTLPNRPNTADVTANAVVFQQDRLFTGANKWGAYFRYDLEIQRPPRFNWNGAIHTDGSLFLYSPFADLTTYLISAPNSCYFLPAENSGITMRGLLMGGTLDQDTASSGGRVYVHLHPGSRITPNQTMRLTDSGGHPNPPGPGTFDSQDAVRAGFTPTDLAMDPLYLITNNKTVARRREGGSEDYATYKDTNWGGGVN
jgi:hypothetical protein